MKVCHVITGLNNGGAEGALYRLCSAGWPENYRHIVISLMDRGVYADKLERCGVEVHCLYMPRSRITLGAVFALWRLLVNLQPSVVQTWMYHADLVGGIIARLAGIKSIAWGIRHANLDPEKNSRATLFLIYMCARLSMWLPSRIVSCSSVATDLHKSIGFFSEKFVTIPNGYFLDNLQVDANARSAVRDSLSLPESMPVVGMVARFDPQKDHNNFLAALGLLKKQGNMFTCLLVGMGMDAGNLPLVEEIKRADIENEVRLLGARHDIPAVMNAIDIHVLSSLGEAFPNVLAEAMACGTPCVTTDVGDAAFIVADTGWVVPPRKPYALADAIAAALGTMKDNDTWQQRQLACRQRIVDNFSINKMVSAYRQVWESILAEESHKGFI